MYKAPTIRFGLPWRQPENPPKTVAPEVLIAPETAAPRDAEAAETMARALEATGGYKILRRLVLRAPESPSTGDRIGLIIDLETTGLDTLRNEVLEIAAIKFGYADDRITSVIDTLQAFQQPSAPIEPAITALTGITDAMVEGHRIDSVALEQFVSDVHIVIAHNAAFDRKVAERHWPIFSCRHWACSATGIDWKAYGFGGARLSYLLAECGLFHDAHRALDDCHAVLEILARNLPVTEKTGLAILLDRARRLPSTPPSRSRTCSSNAGIAGMTAPMVGPSLGVWTSTPMTQNSSFFGKRSTRDQTWTSCLARSRPSIGFRAGFSCPVAKHV